MARFTGHKTISSDQGAKRYARRIFTIAQRLNALGGIFNLKSWCIIMSSAVQSLSFQDLIEAVEAMPLEDQSILVELINKHITEKRRAELIAEVQEARDALKRGDVKSGTFEDLMKDLKD